MTTSVAPAFDPPLVVEWTETPASAAAALQIVTRLRYRRTGLANSAIVAMALFALAVVWGVSVARFDLDLRALEALGLPLDWLPPVGVAVTIAPAVALMIALLRVQQAALRADLAPGAGVWRVVADETTVRLTDPTHTDFTVRWDRIIAIHATPAIAVFAIGAMAAGWAPASAFPSSERYVAFVDACANRLSAEARDRSVLKHRA